MTAVKWLIEDLFENNEELIQEIKSQDMVATYIKYKPFLNDQELPFGPNECVIALGSINLCRQVQRTQSWYPGTWVDWNNFNCLTYYAYFGKYLLSKEYRILPFGEAIRKFNLYRAMWDRVFIRPCDGSKSFSGQEVTEDLFKHSEQYGKPELPVILSPYQTVHSEFRVFVSENEVLGGSMYYDGQGNLNPRPLDFENDHKVVNFANKLLQSVSWKPAPIFCFDIGFNGSGDIGLVELTSFNCCGWYATETKKIVAKAKELALREYNEFCGNYN